jgi:hypothetical protein
MKESFIRAPQPLNQAQYDKLKQECLSSPREAVWVPINSSEIFLQTVCTEPPDMPTDTVSHCYLSVLYNTPLNMDNAVLRATASQHLA